MSEKPSAQDPSSWKSEVTRLVASGEKTLALGLAVSMTIALAGCGGEGAGSSSTQGAAPPGSQGPSASFESNPQQAQGDAEVLTVAVPSEVPDGVHRLHVTLPPAEIAQVTPQDVTVSGVSGVKVGTPEIDASGGNIYIPITGAVPAGSTFTITVGNVDKSAAESQPIPNNQAPVVVESQNSSGLWEGLLVGSLLSRAFSPWFGPGYYGGTYAPPPRSTPRTGGWERAPSPSGGHYSTFPGSSSG